MSDYDDADLFWCEFCQMDSRTVGHAKFHALGLEDPVSDDLRDQIAKAVLTIWSDPSLHAPYGGPNRPFCGLDSKPWPCPTVRALDGAAQDAPPADRGCRWCHADLGEWCEIDCGSPSPALHPDFRDWDPEADAWDDPEVAADFVDRARAAQDAPTNPAGSLDVPAEPATRVGAAQDTERPACPVCYGAFGAHAAACPRAAQDTEGPWVDVCEHGMASGYCALCPRPAAQGEPTTRHETGEPR